ncbi:MAG: glycoside hydrolase family 130 protein [Flavisolibacter sp.]
MPGIKPLLSLVLIALLASPAFAQQKPWMLPGFEKADAANPCLLPSSQQKFFDPIVKREIAWESKDVFNPAAVVRNGKIYLLYRAEDRVGRYAGTSRIGLAESSDGLYFSKRATPVLYPDNDKSKILEWEGGCEDPRVVEDASGQYYMTYTAYDGKTARLLIATSTDLVQWQKHGPVFSGKWRDQWSKSGAVICKRDGSRMVAQKINGKYWMYWGDTDIFLATSDDLVHWSPVLDAAGKPKPFISPREGYFDSDLVEPGPPAIVTDEGILLIYNSRNKEGVGDSTLPAGTYSAGQALFSKTDPGQLLDRDETNFFRPEKPYEISGQVNNVCFLEGLVYFKDKWFLYYGTADSKIAVAVSEKKLK